ncbi:MAG TPA: histidinol dehydrogenase [Myxococcaceae bacterium]|nr:histidinol dehydrogenase [Myxococcaceae bacterium]
MSDQPWRFRGALAELDREGRAFLCRRDSARDPSVRERTRQIISQVRQGGDGALRALALELDGVRLDSLEVPRRLWGTALRELQPELRSALERAAANIARAHRAFVPRQAEVETEAGVRVGRRPDPLRRVGIYAPGGRASYPSSLLMAAVPARVAGVAEVIVCSPPAPSGTPSLVVLAAAEIGQVDRLFALGGAGAIAAMAFGTDTVPRVDRIVGPGNAYVAEAKMQLSSEVGIDLPAGPSELLAIADAAADPKVIAREMLAQAEHDPDASVVALAVGRGVADPIEAALRDALREGARAEAQRSLSARGAVLSVSSLEEALDFAAEFAPEHLLLALSAPDAALEKVRNAGAVFVGETSSVAFGDYLTGANHVLPTAGLGRAYSGLSVIDFMRWTSYQQVDRAAAARLAEDTGLLAESEGLPAHAAAARAWRRQG